MEDFLRHIFTTMEPTSTNLIMPAWLDITAILFGAAFGSLSAKEHNLDLLGSIVLGIVCGLGGGLIRDIILQRGGVYMIQSPIAIPICLLAAFLVFFFSGLIIKLGWILPWIDILSVVLFAASGTEKAVLYSVSVFGSVMLGTMTGVGGGMLRDMMLGEVPSLLRRGNFYSLCALVGSFTYYVCVHAGMIKEVACGVCVVLGVGLWWLSQRFNWLSPMSVDLTPLVVKPVKKIVKATPVVRQVASAVASVSRQVEKADRTWRILRPSGNLEQLSADIKTVERQNDAPGGSIGGTTSASPKADGGTHAEPGDARAGDAGAAGSERDGAPGDGGGSPGEGGQRQ